MFKWAYLLLIVTAATVGARMVSDLASESRSAGPNEPAEAPHPYRPGTADSPHQPSVTDQPSSMDETNREPSTASLLDPDIARRLQELAQERQREADQSAALHLESTDTDAAAVDRAASGSSPAGPAIHTGKNDGAVPPEPSRQFVTVRQQSPQHNQMITPGNFEYLGAFRPPLTDQHGSRFSYGGVGLTFHEEGDAEGAADGFPGSLFLVGHRHDQRVAEISIPRPVVSPSKNIDDLPIAAVLQPLSDVTGGIRNRLSGQSSEPFEIGGLQVVHDRLHWTLYKYYNVDAVDYFSHGSSSLDLSDPRPKGLWHLGPAQSGDPRWHSYKHAGYICEVPEPVASQYLGGRNLMSGLQISTGRQTSSQGPALFAYRLAEPLPRNGASLNALPLLWYPMNRMVPQHHGADLWRGAAWLTLAGKQAVVIVGRKALGPERYGEAQPGDCYEYKGYHGSAYEVQMLFYAPGNLVAASRTSVPAVKPWYRWDRATPGGSLNRFMYQKCGREVGGLAYDRRNQLLYLSELEAGRCAENEWEDLPVIHTFRLVE